MRGQEENEGVRCGARRKRQRSRFARRRTRQGLETKKTLECTGSGAIDCEVGSSRDFERKASGTRVQSQSGAENCLSYDESEQRVYIGSSREREDKATIWSSTESKRTVRLRRIVSLAGDNPHGVVGNEVGEPVKMERVYGYGKRDSVREVGVGVLRLLGVRSRKLKGSGKSEIQYKRKSVRKRGKFNLK